MRPDRTFFLKPMILSSSDAALARYRPKASCLSYAPAMSFGVRVRLLFFGEPDTVYIVKILTGVKDQTGNSLDQDPTMVDNQPMKWSFKTRS
jgi:hypothetical protein